ncbi:MAG: DUF1223 domain-containing protein, partial [Rhodospirillales bacterium]|nr:DUF1223 domain-containing protein [Rhodospirillales bacterium]
AGLAPDTRVGLIRDKTGTLNISIASVPYPVLAAVWLVYFDPKHKTRARRGENRGRTIFNYNVVRAIKRIGEWRGRELVLKVPGKDIKSQKTNGGAVIIQAEQKGPILGAQRISFAPTN